MDDTNDFNIVIISLVSLVYLFYCRFYYNFFKTLNWNNITKYQNKNFT